MGFSVKPLRVLLHYKYLKYGILHGSIRYLKIFDMAFISKCITTEETDFLSRRNACCVRVSISRAKAMTFLAMCEDHGPDGRPWVEPIVFSAGLEGGKRNVWVRLRARLSADVSRANLLITVNLSVGDGGIESRSWAYQGWQHTSARLRTRSLNALSQREWACQGRGTALLPAVFCAFNYM